MVYLSPEKRMEERKISTNPTFDGDSSLFSALNTPFVRSGAPQPLSPVDPLAGQGILDDLSVKRTKSLSHIAEPPLSKIVISQSPYGSKNDSSVKLRKTSTPELASSRRMNIPEDKSIGIDLQSRQCESLSTDTSKSPARSLAGVGKSFVGRVPSIGGSY